ncbi:hypothetical protein KTO58_21095 [Chitinophaga pendula]|uniref:hypothetical protein n=1 Tax=Chitinophaga TaxID=79328 RepID=UPI000BAE7DF1|nr:MULTISPECIES: hypothetical protein [Chitinophaga]ASZ10871.1 hypothetical protein CK934_07710 [Chitinophaga sp. MD30]UCJ06146.1 hypothetical protein KTO58_21095 [Chitinophaga pendula]
MKKISKFESVSRQALKDIYGGGAMHAQPFCFTFTRCDLNPFACGPIIGSTCKCSIFRRPDGSRYCTTGI